MGTLLDYLYWRGDLRFSEVELCEVDSLILSNISYLDFDGLIPTPEEGGSIPSLEVHLLAIGYALIAFGIGAVIYKKFNHKFLYYV